MSALFVMYGRTLNKRAIRNPLRFLDPHPRWEKLRWAIQKAIEWEPERRITTAHVLAGELREALLMAEQWDGEADGPRDETSFNLERFGRYELDKPFHIGGMSISYRAHQIGPGGYRRAVMLKRIREDLRDDPRYVRMFLGEAKIASTLSHPSVVCMLDFDSTDGEFFLVNEYIHGRDLLDLLVRCTHLRIRLPTKLCVLIVSGILEALGAIHSATTDEGTPLQIVHRDVSPSNVFVSHDGIVRLGDFGISEGTPRGETLGGLMGKLGYMAPELVRASVVDSRGDIFAAGVLLFEMLAMNRLFHGKTELETLMLIYDCDIEAAIDRLPHCVPSGLHPILRRALARDPMDRYQVADDFLADLEPLRLTEDLRCTTKDLSRFMRSVFVDTK